MEHLPELSAQMPLPGPAACVSFVVLTVNVACAGGKVRGCAARNGRTLCAPLGMTAGLDAAATDNGATATAVLKIPPRIALVRNVDLDIEPPDPSARTAARGRAGRTVATSGTRCHGY